MLKLTDNNKRERRYWALAYCVHGSDMPLKRGLFYPFYQFCVLLLCHSCLSALATCETKCSNRLSYAEACIYWHSVRCVVGLKSVAVNYNNVVAGVVTCSRNCPELEKNDTGPVFLYATLNRHACRSSCQQRLLHIPDTPRTVIEFAEEVSYDSLRLCTSQASIMTVRVQWHIR